jgi:aryl-alcohol dehydrogenase-like predicted oxidoreductase
MIRRTNTIAIQHQYNLFINSDDILADCETYDLASINRSPLAMGILGGKYHLNSKPFEGADK